MKFELIVRPRSGARDPQADAVSAALQRSEWSHIKAHSVGRYMLLSVHAQTEEQAQAAAHSVCQQLLVNPLLEQYELRAIREPLSDEDSAGNPAR
jgi:phosphoribosylformylglycinamidine synthase